MGYLRHARTYDRSKTRDRLRARAYGDGATIVVVGVTPHQGDGSPAHRAKRDRWSDNRCHQVRVMRIAQLALIINRGLAMLTTGELLDTESGHEQF